LDRLNVHAGTLAFDSFQLYSNIHRWHQKLLNTNSLGNIPCQANKFSLKGGMMMSNCQSMRSPLCPRVPEPKRHRLQKYIFSGALLQTPGAKNALEKSTITESVRYNSQCCVGSGQK